MKTKTLKQATAFCAAALLVTGSMANEPNDARAKALEDLKEVLDSKPQPQKPVYESLYEKKKAGVNTSFQLADGAVSVTLNRAEIATRYRVDDSDVQEQLERLQASGVMDVSIGVFEDRLVLNLMASTGSQFNTTFDDTGILDGDEDINFNLRRLSLTYRPGENVELEVGSMAPVNACSDITGISEEGWVTGYRAKVTYEKGFLVVTGGMLAPEDDANIFDRDESGLEDLASLEDFNYISAILNNQIGAAITAGLGLTHYDDQFYATGALSLNVSQWTQILDSIAVEATFTEQDDDNKAIWAVTAAKRFEEVIGSKDIQVALSYISADEGIALPRSEYVMDGDSIRLSVSIPNLVEKKHFTIGLYVDALFGFSDENNDGERLELGLKMEF